MADPTEIDLPALRLRGRFTCEAAPVQAEGVVDGQRFAFHARHEAWSFAVAPSPEVDPFDVQIPGQGFLIEEPYGSAESAASYMPLDEARQIIARCAEAFARDRAP